MEFAIRANAEPDCACGQHLSCSRRTHGPSEFTGLGWSVAMMKLNDFGLVDSVGNLWCWCADWLGEYPTELTVDPRDLKPD
ncbi:MAG: hypothetical protein EXS15_02725 [Phycisphaerales bacterium]|nr:hypothetical protein [Phycisphaerales bacterium]